MAQLRKFNNSGALVLPWETAQDEHLSFLARGVLAYVLSMPAGWDFSIERIAKSCKATVKGSGREAVTAAMRELEDRGYRRVVVERDDAGRTRRVPEFAYRPVAEWAEAAVAARAARTTNTASRSPASQATASRSLVRPGETPGGAKLRDASARDAVAIRETYSENNTHNAREDVVESSAPLADGVCEPSPSLKDEGARAGIGWDVTPEQVTVGEQILKATVHPEVAHLIAGEDRERLAAKCGALLARGWSRQLVERTLNRRTNAATVAPVVVVERALNEAIKESLTPSPHRVGVERAGRPTRAKLDHALAVADRLHPDEAEFAKITAWLKRASAADVDKWLADRKAEAEAAPLHIPMTNAPTRP